MASTKQEGKVTHHNEFNIEVVQREAKIFEAVIIIGTDVMQAVFNTMYCHAEMDTNNGSITLDRWLKNLDISGRSIKESIGAYYKNIEKNPLNEKFDIKFYYAAIVVFNKKISQYFNESCYNDLSKIKLMRHKLSHVCFPFENEHQTLNDLQHTYVRLLKDVSRALGNKKYTKKLIVEIPKKISKIKKHNMDIQSYKKLKSTLLKDATLAFIHNAQKELSEANFNRKFTTPFSWLQGQRSNEKGPLSDVYDIQKVFTSPWMQYNDAELQYQSLFSVGSHYANDIPNIVIVSGHGGSGKTTLCHHIFTEWQYKHKKDPSYDTLKQFDLVLLVEINCANSKTIKLFLRDKLLVNTVKKLDESMDHLYVLKQVDVLYLIDGFDEKNNKRIQLVNDIIKNCSGRSRILLTTRPAFLSLAINITSGKNCIVVYLNGFNKVAQEEYAKKIIAISTTKDEVENLHRLFCEFLREKNKIFVEHLKFPLTVSLLVLLWLDWKSCKGKANLVIKTGTQLYLELFAMLTEKLCNARRNWKKANVSLSSDSPPDAGLPLVAATEDRDKVVRLKPEIIKTIVHELSNVALNQLRGDQCLYLTDENIENVKCLCDTKSIKIDEFMSAFMIFDWSEESKQYSFVHRTQMEYMSANYMVKNIINSSGSDFHSYFKEDMLKFLEILPFLVGCISIACDLEKYASELISLAKQMQVSQSDYNFFYKFLFEADSGAGHHSLQNNCCKGMLCTQVADYISQEKWQLKANSLMAGLTLLAHCYHIRIKELEIDLSLHVDPEKDENLNDLLDTMKRLQSALKSIKNRNQTVLSFRLAHHLSSSALSDKYLHCLHPWANLVKFTGHIGTGSISPLSRSCQLKDLHIKISSVEIFNSFFEMCYPKYFNLKKLELILNFPETDNIEKLKKIPEKDQCTLRLYVHGISSDRLDHILKMIHQIVEGDYPIFERVLLDGTDLSFEDGKKVLCSLDNLVFTMISVNSSKDHYVSAMKKDSLRDLTDSKGKKIRIQVKFEWNNRIILNDR